MSDSQSRGEERGDGDMESRSWTHYPLGLDDKDRVNETFGGGFPVGSIVLLIGENGTGKSVLSQRFMYGMLTEGVNVSLVSASMDYQDLIRQMNSLSYPVTQYVIDEQFRFYTTNLPHEEIGIDSFADWADPWESDVLIFDGFEQLFQNDVDFDHQSIGQSEQSTLNDVIAFLDNVTRRDKTVILTINPYKIDNDLLQPFKDNAEVLLKLQAQKSGGSDYINVDVRKFARSQLGLDGDITFEVMQGRGISIMTREVS